MCESESPTLSEYIYIYIYKFNVITEKELGLEETKILSTKGEICSVNKLEKRY
jgi:hypothetical protein